LEQHAIQARPYLGLVFGIVVEIDSKPGCPGKNVGSKPRMPMLCEIDGDVVAGATAPLFDLFEERGLIPVGFRVFEARDGVEPGSGGASRSH